MIIMKGSFLGYVLIAIFVLQFSTPTNSCSSTRPLPKNTDTQYIRTSCNTTTYPRLCYHSLSVYASKIKTDPKLLAHTALNVTLNATKSTSRLMKKISRIHGFSHRVAAAVADCVEVVGDSVDELQRSIREMGQAKGSKFYPVMADIQTWVSAALTDDDTCMDGLAGLSMKGNVKILIRRHIVKISHLTSNALALINNYASSQSQSEANLS